MNKTLKGSEELVESLNDMADEYDRKTHAADIETMWDAADKISELLKYIKTLESRQVYLYNSGYLRGHNDTVEGVFSDVYYTDMHTENDDIVEEIVEDLDEE